MDRSTVMLSQKPDTKDGKILFCLFDILEEVELISSYRKQRSGCQSEGLSASEKHKEIF